jgi:hypothetical protein
MVVRFTTTCAISAYHHYSCEFEPRSWQGVLDTNVQHYVIKFVSDLRQVSGFLRVLRFPPPIKLSPRYSWNIIESGIKYHNPTKQLLFSLTEKSRKCDFCSKNSFNKRPILKFISQFEIQHNVHFIIKLLSMNLSCFNCLKN